MLQQKNVYNLDLIKVYKFSYNPQFHNYKKILIHLKLVIKLYQIKKYSIIIHIM